MNREVKFLRKFKKKYIFFFYFLFFIFFFFWGGVRSGDVRGGGVTGCERRIEVFVKIQKKMGGQGGVGGREGSGWGVRVDVIEELKFLGKFTKKIRWGGSVWGGGSGWGCQGGCE